MVRRETGQVPLRDKSGDDVGDDAVAQRDDLVLQQQLSLLEAGNLDHRREAIRLERRDLIVEPAVLRPESLQELTKIVIVRRHRITVADSRPAVTSDATSHVNDRPPHSVDGQRIEAGQKRIFVIYSPVVTSPRKGRTPMDYAQAEALEAKHAQLEALIDEEEHRPHPDDIRLHQLKKEKLRVKDEMVGH